MILKKYGMRTIDNDKYTECVAKYINTYLDSLAVQRNNYYNDIIENGDFESKTHQPSNNGFVVGKKMCA